MSSNVYKFLDVIKVKDTELTKIRIGNENDGGYIALEELCAWPRVVYSAGIGTDVGFELDWVSRYPNCKFELYDPTISYLPQEHKRFTLHRYGIGVKHRALTNVVQDSVLKMDIEWDEWGALGLFDDDELKKFSQMFIEFHAIHVEPRSNLSPYFTKLYNNVMEQLNEDLFASYYTVIKRLLNWFYIFHVHANNSLPMVSVNGYMFPPLLELSFVRRDLVKRHVPAASCFPIEGLDRPNKTNRPDILDFYPLTGNSHD